MAKFRFSKVAVIAGDGDIAEQVCTHFRTYGVYLPVFEAPLKRLVEYGVFTADCIRVANAIRFLGSKNILLLGCEEDVIGELMRHLPDRNLVLLDSFDQNALSKLPGYKVPKTQRSADFRSNEFPIGHIIAVEDNDSLSKVVARNLANAIGGYVVVVPPASREEAEEAQEYMRVLASSNDNLDRLQAKETLLSLIKKRLSNLTSKSPESISFITEGIPYGVFPFNCPTTHYFHFPLLGLNVIRGMMKSVFPYLRCTTAYLVDPGEFPKSEFEDLREVFLSRGYMVRKSFGHNAKVREVNYSTQYLPLDFIFYSTHCGEVEGRRIKERFATSDGKEHIVIYDLAASFAPKPGTDLIEVLELKRWVSLDGIDWSDKEGKKRIKAGDIIGEYIEICRRRTNEETINSVIETSDIGPIKHSDALKMSDFNFMPIPTELGDHKFPLVFNNACSTWRELAHRFAVAGACIYIGTSMDIPNSLAVDVVTKFAGLLANGRTAGYSLFNAQRRFVSELQYTPYLMHGYLFTKCLPLGSREDNAKYFLRELTKSTMRWDEHIRRTQSEEVKKNSEEILLFLRNEVNRFRRSV